MRNLKMLVYAATCILLMASTALAQQKVEIVFWHWWSGDNEVLLQEVIDRFEEDYPWIDIIPQQQSWTNRPDRVMMAMISATGPDVLMTAREELTNLALQGLIVPLTELVEENGLDLDIFYPQELAGLYWQGELYALPMASGGATDNTFYYNKRLFREAGLDPNLPPETWEALREAHRKLTITDGRELVQIGIDPLWGYNTIGEMFPSWLASNNTTLLDAEGRKVVFHEEGRGLETLNYIVQLYDDALGAPMVQQFMHAAFEQNRFFTEDMAMCLYHSGFSKNIWDLFPKLDFGIGVRPYNSDNPEAAPAGTISRGWGNTIPYYVSPEKYQAAYLFIEWLAAALDGGSWFVRQQGRPSPVIEHNEHPQYYNVNPYWDYVKFAMETSIPVAIPPINQRLMELVTTMVGHVRMGFTNPTAAQEQAVEQMQLLLDEYWNSLW